MANIIMILITKSAMEEKLRKKKKEKNTQKAIKLFAKSFANKVFKLCYETMGRTQSNKEIQKEALANPNNKGDIKQNKYT